MLSGGSPISRRGRLERLRDLLHCALMVGILAGESCEVGSEAPLWLVDLKRWAENPPYGDIPLCALCLSLSRPCWF